jgi:predicted transcriptional regulator
MKKVIVKCFDEKETRLAKDLNNLGLKTHAAIMIVYLQKVKETNSKDMKERTDLPYPNISLAGKELLDNKWISVRKQKKTGRFGRPSKIYKLETEMSDIIKYLEEQRAKEVEEWIKKMSSKKSVGEKSI